MKEIHVTWSLSKNSFDSSKFQDKNGTLGSG